ncbi:MAG: Spy/CpxP family protein refolding chaperone [Bdellovibrionales bacterium]
MKKQSTSLLAFCLLTLLAVSPAFAQGGGMMQQPRPVSEAEKTMHEAMLKVRRDHKALFASMIEKKKELHLIVKAPKFDRHAFLAKHKEIDDIKTQMHLEQLKAQADILGTMSAEQRATLRMAQGRKGPHKPGKHQNMGNRE